MVQIGQFYDMHCAMFNILKNMLYFIKGVQFVISFVGSNCIKQDVHTSSRHSYPPSLCFLQGASKSLACLLRKRLCNYRLYSFIMSDKCVLIISVWVLTTLKCKVNYMIYQMYFWRDILSLYLAQIMTYNNWLIFLHHDSPDLYRKIISDTYFQINHG